MYRSLCKIKGQCNQGDIDTVFSFSTADPISQALALLARVQPCFFPLIGKTQSVGINSSRTMVRDFIGTTFQLASTDPAANGNIYKIN